MKKKKGFTLVELIVVLAILAILAAMLVPALTGYIDKANEKKLNSTTRQVVVAAQTVLSEAYARNGGTFESNSLMAINWGDTITFSEDNRNQINLGEICILGEVGEDIVKTPTIYNGTSTQNGQPFVYDGYKYEGKLKSDIKYMLITYDSHAKLERVEINFGDKTCKYDGVTETYTTN